MDIVYIGIYNQEDQLKLDLLAAESNIIICWDFRKYNFDSYIGSEHFKKYYNFIQIGCFLESSSDNGFISSYSLVNEISDYHINSEWRGDRLVDSPRLFRFFDHLQNSGISKE